MSLKVLIVSFVSVCLSVFFGCDSNREQYERAIATFCDEDFDTALTMFNSLPKHYKDVDLFFHTTSAVIEYKSGSWLNAVRSFESLSIQLAEICNNKEKYSDEYLVKLIENLLISLDSAIRNQSIPFEMDSSLGYLNGCMGSMKSFVEEPKKYSFDRYHNKSDWNLFGCLYYESLFRYYEEQTQLGYDIAKLPDYPYKPGSSQRENDLVMFVRKRRMDKLNERVKERKLEEFYTTTDASISPVEVIGTGIYVNITKAEKTGASYRDRIIRAFPPSYLADTPENVRYVFLFTEKYSYFSTYTDGTKGYTTTTSVTLKDVATGEIIYTNQFTAKPSESVITSKWGEGDTYGNDCPLDFKKDILPALEKIFTTLYDWW